MATIENLIFSGGGVKGVGLGAVLAVLDDLGALDNVTGFAGTSIGAMVACMLAVGYRGNEIRNMILHEYNYENMIGDLSPLRILLDATAYGFNPGEKLLQLIRRKITEKTGKDIVTFDYVRKTMGKVLKIYVTNLNLGIYQELSPDTEPDMDIALAVRASASLPIIFDPVIYRGDYLVDGGMMYNFPENAFPPERSVGFVFVHKLAEDSNQPAVPLRDPIRSRLDYFSQLTVCTLRSSSKIYNKKLAICEIEVGHTSTRDFDITFDQKMELDWLGFKSICFWLEKLKK